MSAATENVNCVHAIYQFLVCAQGRCPLLPELLEFMEVSQLLALHPTPSHTPPLFLLLVEGRVDISHHHRQTKEDTCTH